MTARVLGLDPGSRVVGYAILDSTERGRFAYKECGIFRTTQGSPVEARLLEIASELRELIREHSPSVAAVEDVFQHKNARSALVLGQARGAALLVLAESGIAVTSYPPATVKRTVCGNGRASKEQVQRMVTALSGLRRPPSVDASDALALAICYCLHAGGAQARSLPDAKGALR
ncbi:MAG: crossover junction endodeoxyribonuclease RuvC [Polyangia bacterium]|mgnify:CR=1 FL=1|jgi:crossover junction endodeoxyribonuclease RuvC|nr:crossover junction endodeoxyribonuclease RuvC [Polyangia bacterium]